jgi:hypothetical protein
MPGTKSNNRYAPIPKPFVNGLTQVYRSDLALFLNVSERYLDPNVWKNSHFRHSKQKS